MMTFSTPSLEKQLRQVLRSLDAEPLPHAEVEIAGQYLPIDFDPSEHEDIVVSDDTPVVLTLRRSDPCTLSVADLCALVAETTAKSTTFDGHVFVSGQRLIVSVGPQDYHSVSFFDKQPETTFATPVLLDGIQFVARILHGSPHFGLAVILNGFPYDKHNPPHLDEYIFVEVSSPAPFKRDIGLSIAESFMFELASSHGLVLEDGFRLEDDDFEEDEEEAEEGEDDSSSGDERPKEEPRLRSLLLGRGMLPLLQEFRKALTSYHGEFSVLCYVKCIEYVSGTVVRIKQYEDVRRRLLTREALDPDANFIDSLVVMFEENRLFKKDYEALKLTIERCCDPLVLSAAAPPCIGSLLGLRPDSKEADRRNALSDLAVCLSATRNRIAHAKANYEPTGRECPDEQLYQLSKCAQIAAEQCIRWYADTNPSMRRT